MTGRMRYSTHRLGRQRCGEHKSCQGGRLRQTGRFKTDCASVGLPVLVRQLQSRASTGTLVGSRDSRPASDSATTFFFNQEVRQARVHSCTAPAGRDRCWERAPASCRPVCCVRRVRLTEHVSARTKTAALISPVAARPIHSRAIRLPRPQHLRNPGPIAFIQRRAGYAFVPIGP